MSALQLFGIIPIEPGIDPPAEGTSLVGFRSIAAVVAPCKYKTAQADQTMIADYAKVVEGVHARVAILPAPPGTVFRSRVILARWLELHYVTLTDALAALEGNAAARVTVRLRPGAPEGGTLGALGAWQELAAESLRALRVQAMATPQPGSVDDGDPGVVARTSFLLPRENWESFASGVQAEARRHPHLDFTVTGPWPAYDFVRMEFGS